MIWRASARSRNQFSFEAFIAELPVEAFNEGVLGRLAGVDEVEPNAVAPGPLVEHLADHLGPVVENDLLRQPASLGQALQDPHDPGTGSEVSTSIAGHSREKSSTMLSVRKR